MKTMAADHSTRNIQSRAGFSEARPPAFRSDNYPFLPISATPENGSLFRVSGPPADPDHRSQSYPNELEDQRGGVGGPLVDDSVGFSGALTVLPSIKTAGLIVHPINWYAPANAGSN